MREAAIPLFSTESFAPVADFDVLGFSLQAELNYSNILNMLDLAGLPVWQRDRRERDPIVLGGGPCTANPEPIADFFDAFLIGDAEEALPVFLDAYRDGRARGLSRRDAPRAARRDRGHLRPVALRRRVRRGRPHRGDHAATTRARPSGRSAPGCRSSKPEYYPDKPMVPSVEIVQDRLGLEVMRGCTQGCRFCQAGYWYRPVRELDPGDVADMTKKFIAESGWSEVGLLSLSTADYSQIEPLVKCLAPQLSDRRVSISLPSLRAEAFSVGLADAVSEVRKSGFTFAPETGSDRLRRVINKTFTNADMIAAAVRPRRPRRLSRRPRPGPERQSPRLRRPRRRRTRPLPRPLADDERRLDEPDVEGVAAVLERPSPLRGERVVLRPLTEADRPAIRRILDDPSVARWWGPGGLETRVDEWFSDDDTVRFAIVVDSVVGGTIQFHEEDEPDYRHAGLDIFLDEGHQGRGLRQRRAADPGPLPLRRSRPPSPDHRPVSRQRARHPRLRTDRVPTGRRDAPLRAGRRWHLPRRPAHGPPR